MTVPIETTCARCSRPIIVPPTGITVCTCGLRLWANDYGKATT